MHQCLQRGVFLFISTQSPVQQHTIGLVSSLQLLNACLCDPSPAVASGVLGTYTTENYPTPVRATAMGMFNQAARCGSIAAPCILMLGALTGPAGGAGALVLPYLAFGSISLAAGVLVLFMPETLGADMPESMEVRDHAGP